MVNQLRYLQNAIPPPRTFRSIFRWPNAALFLQVWDQFGSGLHPNKWDFFKNFVGIAWIYSSPICLDKIYFPHRLKFSRSLDKEDSVFRCNEGSCKRMWAVKVDLTRAEVNNCRVAQPSLFNYLYVNREITLANKWLNIIDAFDISFPSFYLVGRLWTFVSLS